MPRGNSKGNSNRAQRRRQEKADKKQRRRAERAEQERPWVQPENGRALLAPINESELRERTAFTDPRYEIQSQVEGDFSKLPASCQDTLKRFCDHIAKERSGAPKDAVYANTVFIDPKQEALDTEDSYNGLDLARNAEIKEFTKEFANREYNPDSRSFSIAGHKLSTHESRLEESFSPNGMEASCLSCVFTDFYHTKTDEWKSVLRPRLDERMCLDLSALMKQTTEEREKGYFGRFRGAKGERLALRIYSTLRTGAKKDDDRQVVDGEEICAQLWILEPDGIWFRIDRKGWKCDFWGLVATKPRSRANKFDTEAFFKNLNEKNPDVLCAFLYGCSPDRASWYAQAQTIRIHIRTCEQMRSRYLALSYAMRQMGRWDAERPRPEELGEAEAHGKALNIITKAFEKLGAHKRCWHLCDAFRALLPPRDDDDDWDDYPLLTKMMVNTYSGGHCDSAANYYRDCANIIEKRIKGVEASLNFLFPQALAHLREAKMELLELLETLHELANEEVEEGGELELISPLEGSGIFEIDYETLPAVSVSGTHFKLGKDLPAWGDFCDQFPTHMKDGHEGGMRPLYEIVRVCPQQVAWWHDERAVVAFTGTNNAMFKQPSRGVPTRYEDNPLCGLSLEERDAE